MRDQHILDIAKAYQSIYISEDNVNEFLGQLGSTLEKAADTYVKPTVEKLGADKGRQKVGNLPILGDIGAAAGAKTAGDLYNKGKEQVKSGNLPGALQTGKTALDMLRNSYEPDAFDIILEYLVAEGYADTNKAALAIMANMSEEWKQSIVEDIRGLPYKPPVKRGGPMDEMMRGSRPNSGSSNGSSGAGMRDRDEPLWDSDQKPEDVKVTPTPTRPPVRKPQPPIKKDPPMRDEPLF